MEAEYIAVPQGNFWSRIGNGACNQYAVAIENRRPDHRRLQSIALEQSIESAFIRRRNGVLGNFSRKPGENGICSGRIIVKVGHEYQGDIFGLAIEFLRSEEHTSELQSRVD